MKKPYIFISLTALIIVAGGTAIFFFTKNQHQKNTEAAAETEPVATAETGKEPTSEDNELEWTYDAEISSAHLVFDHPKNFTLTEKDGEIMLTHEIPYPHYGDCDMSGMMTYSETLTDFAMTMKIVPELIITPAYNDGEYVAGDLHGVSVYHGAEGCGEVLYYFQIQDKTIAKEPATLIVSLASVQPLTGISSMWDVDEILKVPGVVSIEDSQKIIKKIIASTEYYSVWLLR